MGAAIAGLVAVPSIVAAESSTTTGSTTGTTTTPTSTSTGTATGTSTSTGTTGGTTQVTATPTVAASTTTGSTATTGSVTTTTGTTVPTSTTTTTTTSVSFQQAVDTAQSFFASKTIVKAVLLDSHSNTPVYMVVFSDGSRLIVDGTSGSVVYSFDTATQTSTGANPFGDKEDSDTDSDQEGLQQFGKASLSAQGHSNARGPQGFERRDR